MYFLYNAHTRRYVQDVEKYGNGRICAVNMTKKHTEALPFATECEARAFWRRLQRWNPKTGFEVVSTEDEVKAGRGDLVLTHDGYYGIVVSRAPRTVWLSNGAFVRLSPYDWAAMRVLPTRVGLQGSRASFQALLESA